MPKFDPSVQAASAIERTPGRWLCVIPREVQVGDRVQPGVETTDHKTGAVRYSKTGHEMWSANAVVTDDMPDAPKGALILGINLLWGGKGQGATYRLLEVMGHPLTDWRKNPAGAPEITPEFFYDRPFVLEVKVDERGYLEPAGFCPYFPPTAKRGPAAQPPQASRGGAPAPAGTTPGNGGQPAAAPKTGKLPF